MTCDLHEGGGHGYEYGYGYWPGGGAIGLPEEEGLVWMLVLAIGVIR